MMGRAPAALGHRIAAAAIDAGVALGVVAVAASLAVTLSAVSADAVQPGLGSVVAVAVCLGWYIVKTAMQGGRGSIGMRVMGLRLAYADDDESLGFGRALGRNLVWMITGAVVVGIFSPLFDPSPWRRGWHDVAVRAVVTDASRARVAPPRPGSVPGVPAAAAAPTMADAVHGRAPAEPAVISLRTAAPAVPVAAPRPAIAPSWAPSAARAAARAPRTLPVDVISTVPGVPTRGGLRPADPQTPPPPTLAMLVWDDGTRHTVYDATLFGRSPLSEPGMRLTPVRDETLSISKTHFEIGADADGTWIVDRHSLNGVVITRGGVAQRIVPGERARMWAGDVLEVGDRTFTVESAR